MGRCTVGNVLQSFKRGKEGLAVINVCLHLEKKRVCRVREGNWSRTPEPPMSRIKQNRNVCLSFRKEQLDGWIRGVVQPVERPMNPSQHSLLDSAVKSYLE